MFRRGQEGHGEVRKSHYHCSEKKKYFNMLAKVLLTNEEIGIKSFS
jgi:hypothetical protein